MFRLLTFGIHLIAFGLAGPVQAEPREPCLKKVLKEFDYVGGREVDYLRVEGLKQRHGMIRVKDLVGKKDEVLIGSEGGHVYLYADGVRYDGELLYLLGGEVHNKVTAVPLGTVIRFKDLPPEQIARLRAQLLARKGTQFRAASCVHGACQELAQVGIYPKSGTRMLPAALYERLLADGFVDSQGKPVEIEILQTEPGDLHHTVRDFEDSQSEEINRTIVQGTALVVIVGGASTGVYFFYKKVVQASPEPKAR